jgi:hypothetical protein
MEIAVPNQLKGSRVYLTDADLPAQQRGRLARTDLEDKIKLLCLLNEHVVIATSHIFESGRTYQALLRNRGLLESGAIVVALRNSCRDFRDFLEQKQSEEPKRSYKGKESEEKTVFLQNNTNRIVSWKVSITQGAFKESFLRDLYELKMNIDFEDNFSEKLYNTFLEEVASLETISRPVVNSLTENLPPSIRSQVLHYIDLNYYLSGASAVESDPVVGSLKDVHFVESKINRAVSMRDALSSDVELFSELMSSLNMPRDILRQLSDKNIMELREDRLLKQFRAKYHQLVEDVRLAVPSSDSTQSVKALSEEIKRYMRSYAREALRSNLANEQTARKIAKVIQVTGYATALVSLMSMPLLPDPLQLVAGVSGALGTTLQLSDPLLQKTLVEPKRGELILFATKARELTSMN